MKFQNGYFIISLDFELYWGVRDKRTLKNYGENIKNVRTVVPRLLELFRQHDIHATWATVGFLFHNSKNELVSAVPALKPDYPNKKLNPYLYLDKIGVNEKEDIFHYGLSLIELIKSFPEQEIGSHTYSHYYCLEEGQTLKTFEADLKTAITVAKKNNIELKSLVFPRNQVNEIYLQKCKELGFTSYRGCEPSWFYEERSGREESYFRRAVRLLDAYVNISGENCLSLSKIKSDFPLNFHSSRFLRPYNSSLFFLEPLRLKRILKSMTYAAQEKQVFHLWWHPHNFGKNMDENFSFLNKILEHFNSLKSNEQFQSRNMQEIANEYLSLKK